MQSTDAYKCCPAGYMVIDDQYYWVEHSIDFAPNWFTFDIEVVRWNITIRETEAPTNPW